MLNTIRNRKANEKISKEFRKITEKSSTILKI